MRIPLVVPVLLLTSTLAGCGTAGPDSPSPAAAGGDEPTTAGALAHVAAEHAGRPDSAVAVSEGDASETFSGGAVGTELRYGSDGEYDGDLLAVLTGKGLAPALSGCDSEESERLAGCVTTDQGTLMWEDEMPESDPGLVYVLADKGETTALVFYAGPTITKDPRELDLPISTETLFAIANDPRVDVTTSAEAVEAGADLPFWKGPAG